MKYLYPIRRGPNDYHYGRTDLDEINIANVCSDKCRHENPIEASDCFRESLLKNKPTIVTIEPRKCCHPKCPNPTTEALNYGYDFQFALCPTHKNKTSVKKVCGFGFPLILKDSN